GLAAGGHGSRGGSDSPVLLRRYPHVRGAMGCRRQSARTQDAPGLLPAEMKIYSAVDRRQREEMKKKTSERKDASTGRARLPGASHSLTSRDIESASSLPLGVGSLVLAKKRSAVCSIDDVGMVYVVRLTSRNPLRM